MCSKKIGWQYVATKQESNGISMLYEEVYSVRDLAIIKDLSSNFQMSWQDAGFDAESFLTYCTCIKKESPLALLSHYSLKLTPAGGFEFPEPAL